MQETDNWSNKDKRNISPEINDYDIPNFNINKGDKSKNKYEQRTMEMWNHYESGENNEMDKTKYKENHSRSHLITS